MSEGLDRETVFLDGQWYSDVRMAILEDEYLASLAAEAASGPAQAQIVYRRGIPTDIEAVRGFLLSEGELGPVQLAVLESKALAFWLARSGAVIVGAVGVLAFDEVTGGRISSSVERLTFYGERAGLMAFGVSWLVASRVLPVLTAPDERVSVLPVFKK